MTMGDTWCEVILFYKLWTFDAFLKSIWDNIRSLTHVWIAWMCFTKFTYNMTIVFLSYRCVCRRVCMLEGEVFPIAYTYNVSTLSSSNTSLPNYGNTLKINQRHKWRRDNLPISTLLCCHVQVEYLEHLRYVDLLWSLLFIGHLYLSGLWRGL